MVASTSGWRLKQNTTARTQTLVDVNGLCFFLGSLGIGVSIQ